MPVFVGDIKIADLLPESKTADQGKVLTVSETGEPAWEETSGAGGKVAEWLFLTDGSAMTRYNGTEFVQATLSDLAADILDPNTVLNMKLYENRSAHGYATTELHVAQYYEEMVQGRPVTLIGQAEAYGSGQRYEVRVGADSYTVTEYPYNMVWHGVEEDLPEEQQHGVIYLVVE